MLKIKDLSVKLKDEDKTILQGINMNVKPGEVHYLVGPNGSGKSTLVSTIMGDPRFEILEGSITLGTEITKMGATERSLLGIFLANQHPLEIPGVSLMQYLRLIYNVRREKAEQLPVFKFKQLVEEKVELINFPRELLLRNLNEGFSGGEKKKTEVLQMLLLEPKYAMLDELDSGLDKKAIKDVFEGKRQYKSMHPEAAFIIISHYDQVKDIIKPDFVHEMDSGVLTE